MDRRKQPRYRFQIPVSFSGSQVNGTGFVLTLSKEGCLIESDHTPREGQYLEMSLSIPEQDAPLMVDSAAVRWTTGRTFGVHFLFMKTTELDRLGQFIEQMGTDEPLVEEPVTTDGKESPDDRRTSPRFQVRFRSSFSSAMMLGGEGTVTDLSARGCRVATATPVPAKTVLEMHLHLEEDGPPIKIPEAVVRWSQDQEFGLEFRDIEPSSYDRLSRLLKLLSTP